MTLNLPERHNCDFQTEELSFGNSPVKVMARLWFSLHKSTKRQNFQGSSPTKMGPKTSFPLL